MAFDQLLPASERHGMVAKCSMSSKHRPIITAPLGSLVFARTELISKQGSQGPPIGGGAFFMMGAFDRLASSEVTWNRQGTRPN